MYAVVKVGGKQERVRAGDLVEVEYMRADPGSTIELEPLVVFDDQGKAHAGRKALSDAKVVARLVGDQKGEKIRVFKYRNKTGYRRNQGHRQLMTLLEIEEIGVGGKKETKDDVAKPAEAEEATEKKPASKKPAAKKAGAKKATSKKPAAKKPASKKPAAKKPAAKKPGGRKKA